MTFDIDWADFGTLGVIAAFGLKVQHGRFSGEELVAIAWWIEIARLCSRRRLAIVNNIFQSTRVPSIHEIGMKDLRVGW